MEKKRGPGRDLKGKKRIYLIIISELAALALFIAAGFFMVSRSPGHSDVISGIRTEKRKEPLGGWIAERNKRKIEPEKLPAPDYLFKEDEITVEMPDIQKEYKLAWISDLHLISDHGPGDVQKPFLFDLEERYETLPVTEEGVHAEELWPEIVKYLNKGDFDAIIFGGDIMDYCSSSNVAVIKEGMDQLYAPFLYIRADHDYGVWYGGSSFTEKDASELHEGIDGDDMQKKYIDMGGFMIVGVNGSTKDMPSSQLYVLQDLYNLRKPVIAVTHVPYASLVDESLEELSYRVRNKIYYWGGGAYVPNEYTKEYLRMIYRDDTKVKQVLAGHMHARWDGMLTEQVPEHIFGPAFEGNVGVIHVVPKRD